MTNRISPRRAGLLAGALASAVALLAPVPASAWWAHPGWHPGWHHVWHRCCWRAPVIVGPPVAVYRPPVLARVWIPPHWSGPYWVPGHWR